MGQDSKIEWTHHTFNPWLGCSKVSPACTHCYAEAWAKRTGIVKWGDSAERRRTSVQYWRQPRQWDAAAMAAGERRRVFCASLADVFEDRPELEEWRLDLFALIHLTPNLDWLLLTKRPENIIPLWCKWYRVPSNVWFGTTVESHDQRLRVNALVQCRPFASVLFLSCEPLLGPLDLSPWLCTCPTKCVQGDGFITCSESGYVDWVICGGESGPKARPMHPDWARSIRDQCVAAGVPFFFKQWGEWIEVDGPRCQSINQSRGNDFWLTEDGHLIERRKPGHNVYSTSLVRRVGKKAAGRLLDGQEWNQFPETKAAATA